MFQYQNEEVNEIIFLMEGQVKVGYNHDLYVIQQNMYEESKELKASALSNLIKSNISKYHYPIVLEPGDAVLGLFEINFGGLS